MSDLPIDGGSVNELWLHLPLTGNDDPTLVITSGGDSDPSKPRLKIGEIDPTVSSNHVTEVNRGASIPLREITGDISPSGNIKSITGGDLGVDTEGTLVLNTSGDNVDDADTLQGNGPSYFGSVQEDETVDGTWTFNYTIQGDISGDAGSLGGTPASDYGVLNTNENITGTWSMSGNQLLTTGDEGNLDAGTLDGYDSAAFAARKEDETITGNWTISSSPTMGTSTPLFFGDSDDLYIQENGRGDLQIGVSGTAPSIEVDSSRLPLLHEGARIDDDEPLEFGTSTDLVAKFDTGPSALQIEDPDANETRFSVPTSGSKPNFPNGLAVDGVSVPTVVVNKTVSLSGGEALVDSGVTNASATLNAEVSVVPSSVSQDCNLVVRYEWDESAGTHKVRIIEDGTAVGNPDANIVATARYV
jgi:hypothetical protein